MSKAMVIWRAAATILVGCTANSEPGFCGTDDVAYLQSHSKGSQGPFCPLDELNSGECLGDGACFRCEPAEDGQKIPTDDTNGFPNGFLNCVNGPEFEAATCTIQRDIGFFYSFQNSNNYLQCTGSQACFGWRVKDISALCCDGNQACRTDARTVRPTEFVLVAGNPHCTQDVCCSGISSCTAGTIISGVRSAACRNFNACEQVTMSLSKDLLCNRPVACRQGSFTFSSEQRGSHCVQCNGAGSPAEPFDQPCEESSMSFNDGNAELQCAFNTCNNATISLTESSCINIKCDDVTSCRDMKVNDVDSSGNLCFCSGDGCGGLAGTLTCSSPSTADPCGANICKEDGSSSAFCDRGLNTPPDCSACTTGGDVEGDPHITTLDGRHYFVREQGNFLLWSFSGLDAEVPSVQGHMRSIPLDFRIYAHYSGRASFAKGILLVDHSADSVEPQQTLELTSQQCVWKSKAVDGWRRVELEDEVNLKDSTDGSIFGAFNVTTSKKSEGAATVLVHQVRLFMRTPSGSAGVAQLWVKCKPGHHLNAQLKMFSAAQNRFVKGELAVAGHSTLRGIEDGGPGARGLKLAAKDTEFAADSSWRKLGGSEEGATYLAWPEQGVGFASVACSEEEEALAMDRCKKLLPPQLHNPVAQSNFLADCVFDSCFGGETAQLAADLFDFED